MAQYIPNAAQDPDLADAGIEQFRQLITDRLNLRDALESIPEYDDFPAIDADGTDNADTAELIDFPDQPQPDEILSDISDLSDWEELENAKDQLIAKMQIEASIANEEFSEELQRLNAIMREQQAQITDLKSDLNQAQSDTAFLRVSQTAHEDELEKVNRKHDRVKSFADSIEQKLQLQAKETFRLSVEIEQQQKILQTKDEEIATLKNMINNLNSDLANQHSSKQVMKAEIADLVAELEKKEDVISKLEAAKLSMKIEIESHQHIAESAKKLVAATRKMSADRIGVLERQIASLED